MIHNKDRQKKQFLNFFSKTTGLRTDVIFVWVLSFDLWYKHNSNTYGFYFFLSFFLFFYSCSAPSKSISISPLSIQCAICIQYNMKRCITNTIIGCKRLLLPNRYAVVDLTYAHYTDYSPINSSIICNENSWIIFFFFFAGKVPSTHTDNWYMNFIFCYQSIEPRYWSTGFFFHSKNTMMMTWNTRIHEVRSCCNFISWNFLRCVPASFQGKKSIQNKLTRKNVISFTVLYIIKVFFFLCVVKRTLNFH